MENDRIWLESTTGVAAGSFTGSDLYFLISMFVDEARGPYVLQFQQTGDIGFLVVVKNEKQIYTYYKGT